MALSLQQSAYAVTPGAPASFAGSGGTEPYVYSVVPGGAGGTINSSTGKYTTPALVSENPDTLYDTIQVLDNLGATATAQILVGTPLLLFCEIIQREMGLASGRVYLWDQKINQPIDNGIYIAVAEIGCKPFANVNRFNGETGEQDAWISMLSRLDVNIISRGPSARDRKAEVLLAVNSDYARRQQDANSFHIGTLPAGATFNNLSLVDGAAIPYRYQISLNLQYAYKKPKATEFYDDFAEAQVTTDP